MQTRDKLEEQLRTLNTAFSVGRSTATYDSHTPSEDSKRLRKRLRKRLIEKLKNNEFETLANEFKGSHFSEQFINEFLKEEGHVILNWLLLDSADIRALQLILILFPPETFKDTLRENNFYILTGFLNARAGMNELGLLTAKSIELDKDKFMLLLTIDPEGVQNFMKRNESAKFMISSTLENYKTALQSLQLDQSSLTEKKISIKSYNTTKKNDKPVLFSNSHTSENSSSSSASIKRASPEKKEEKEDSPLKRNKNSS